MFLNFMNFLKVLVALLLLALYGLGAKVLLFEAMGLPLPLAAGIALVPVIGLGIYAYNRANNPDNYL